MIPVRIVELDDLVFKADQVLAFDTETIGLYGKIRCAQFYQVGDEAVQLVEWPDPMLLAATLHKAHLVMHNAHYDITTTQQQSDTRWIPKLFDCTFLLARLHFYREKKFDLESIMTVALGFDPYKQQNISKKDMHKANWDVPKLTEQQLQYAAIDVFYLLDVYHIVKSANTTFSYELDIHILRHCLDFQWNGLPVDQDRIEAHRLETQKIIDEAAMTINVNSWQQVRKYIGDKDESDDLALATFALEGNDKAGMVRKVRKAIKRLSFLKKYGAVDELIGKFKPSARSGRLTSDDENKQQIPRALKDCFGDKQRYLVFSDYAQLELRTICCITRCRLMEQLFRDGVDMHSHIAEMIFGKDFTKQHRQLTKTANFNWLYGGGIPMYLGIIIAKADILLSYGAAAKLKKKWLRLLREVAQWQEDGIADWRKGIPWQTPGGRRYIGNLMMDHLNIQNQGAGAEVAKLAMHYMVPKLKTLDSAQLANFSHDSYIVVTDTLDEAHEAGLIMAHSMLDAWKEMSKLFAVKDLPMPINVRIGHNWGDIEEGIFTEEINL